MEELAELVASDLGLVGSNGVDFLIGRDGHRPSRGEPTLPGHP
ncbi:hypothetical protein FHEFKHOI_01054 [Candidatus Methanoperedenaceae archaeon GB50]|nr:hypothetical protein FHEFKHOI_01054 [Candidatus Methanoperedenaceae archaeon GB50]